MYAVRGSWPSIPSSLIRRKAPFHFARHEGDVAVASGAARANRVPLPRGGGSWEFQGRPRHLFRTAPDGIAWRPGSQSRTHPWNLPVLLSGKTVAPVLSIRASTRSPPGPVDAIRLH